jgi:hypothetical protein
MNTHTKTGEARYTTAGVLTDAALAEMSIEDRNRYLDEIAASADLDEAASMASLWARASRRARVES